MYTIGCIYVSIIKFELKNFQIDDTYFSSDLIFFIFIYKFLYFFTENNESDIENSKVRIDRAHFRCREITYQRSLNLKWLSLCHDEWWRYDFPRLIKIQFYIIKVQFYIFNNHLILQSEQWKRFLQRFCPLNIIILKLVRWMVSPLLVLKFNGPNVK